MTCISIKLVTCLLLCFNLQAQLTKQDLPEFDLLVLEGNKTKIPFKLDSNIQFVLRRQSMSNSICLVVLEYRFNEEALLINRTDNGEGKFVYHTKYVAPGNPLTLFVRPIFSKDKADQPFSDLCKQGLTEKVEGLENALMFLKLVEWDQSILDQWFGRVKYPLFRRFESDKSELSVSDFDLLLNNDELITSQEREDLRLAPVDQSQFSNFFAKEFKEVINYSYAALRPFVSPIEPEIKLSEFEEPNWFSKLFSNLFNGSKEDKTKRNQISENDMIQLESDISNLLQNVVSTLKDSSSLYQHSNTKIELFNRRILPMFQNHLNILTSLSWRTRERDHYLSRHKLKDKVKSLLHIPEGKATKELFGQVFIQALDAYILDLLKESESVIHLSEYKNFVKKESRKIFNRFESILNKLVLCKDSSIQNKVQLAKLKIQSKLRDIILFFESDEPGIIVQNTKLEKIFKSLGERLYSQMDEKAETPFKERLRLSIEDLSLSSKKKGDRSDHYFKFIPFKVIPKRSTFI